MTQGRKVSALCALLVLATAVLPGHTQAQTTEQARPALLAQSEAQERYWTEREQRRMEQELARAQAEMQRAQKRLQETLAAQQARLTQRLALERAREALKLHLESKLAHLQQLPERLSRQGAWTFYADDPQDIWVSLDGSGWLGVQITEVTPEKVKELKLPAERGVLISEVDADSPASKAGLKANDVVTEFNGQRVEGTAQFRRLVQETPAGRTVQLTVWREGKSQSVSVTLGERSRRGFRIEPNISVGPRIRIPDFRFELPEISLFRGPRLGISGENLDGQLGKYFGAPDGQGVLVREVTSGSPAEKAGLQSGDVIIRVEGNRVKTLSDLREQLNANREKDKVSVLVIRKGAETTFSVELEKPAQPDRRREAVRSRI
jgi:serine protease Do